MKFNPANRSRAVERERNAGLRSGESPIARARFEPGQRPALRRAEAGFTLAEVLAALLLMAIVIPVAVQGLHVASQAGTMAERKAIGARLAENKLNELIVTGQWQSSAQKGTLPAGRLTYSWQMETEPWVEDATMRLVTVHVTVPVQGRDYDVAVSTLVDATQ